jgi:diadenosine tetraphosphate (Ap4A) HIT family hydrolase
MTKYRSIDEPYVKWIIKEYTYWTLLLNEDQRYLGRACAWLVREGGMQRFSEITDEEMSELRIVMREYETALKELSQPDFMNYAWLANLISEHGGHGHMHLVPRYQDSRTFAGVEFTDGRWGKNFSPSEEFKPPEEILLQLRDRLRATLSA